MSTTDTSIMTDNSTMIDIFFDAVKMVALLQLLIAIIMLIQDYYCE